MTGRERLLTVLKGGIPDCVPVAPDFSNMIPARLTGKPFWDLYLYNDPPIWEAYIDCAKRFDIDSLMDGYFPLTFPGEWGEEGGKERFIVGRTTERITVQSSRVRKGQRAWDPFVDVYPVADPPTMDVPVGRLRLPQVPEKFEPLAGVKSVDTGPQGLRKVMEKMGDQGLVGVYLASSGVLGSDDALLDYHENPGKYEGVAERRVEAVERRFDQVMKSGVLPDFFTVGGSGTLIFQTVAIFRKLAFPAVKRAIELATAAGMPTHVHSCGPEKELVRIMAEETNLTVIDPLEVPPMGDCDLAELKARFGERIVLKGNLHTTRVMLKGGVGGVVAASKKAIDEAASGGRFILSTGDQCGRDTPDANIRAMIDAAEEFGRY